MLTRYLVARFLGFFVAFWIVSITTIVVVEMMLNLGDMLRGEAGLSSIASYLLLRLPAYYLRDLVPIVAFAAAFLAVATAARWLEVLAAKAGGVSPHRLAAPLLAAGLLLSASAFVINETWVLEASRRWNERESRSHPIRFREGSFWYQRGRTIYNIGNADRKTGTLRGVRILELDERGRLIRSIDAPEARLDGDDRLRFVSPRVRRFDPVDRARPPSLEQHQGEVSLALQDRGSDALMNADLSTLSVRQLSQVVGQERSRGLPSVRSLALLHARLAEPLTVMLFVLAAIPLGVRVEQGEGRGLTGPALTGIAIVAIFFAVRSAAETLAANGILPPAPTPWTVLGAFTVFGAWRYAGMPG